jgi:spermidine/putrescine transport system ATP-binding protein
MERIQGRCLMTATLETATKSSIELRDLSKTYPGAKEPTLANLSLDIADGEFFSLLGPSGSGKTTTLRLIAGFEGPDSGVVMLDGQDVTKVPPHKRNVNTVFQNYALFPHMDVLKNVEYPLKMKGGSDRSANAKAAIEALELVGMQEYSKRLPNELSGGQRQRVALARALVSRPKVVLLDEPLGALDLQLRQRMQVVLKDLHDQLGITFIYVTHDQGEALAMSDRIAVMNEGRIEQCAPAEDIYLRPQTRFVAGFIGKSNLLDCQLADRVVDWHGVKLSIDDPQGASGAAAVVVRTEAVRILPDGPNGNSLNTFAAHVRQRVFLGDADEVVLTVNGSELVAKVPSSSGVSCAPGDDVTVQVLPSDLRRVHD